MRGRLIRLSFIMLLAAIVGVGGWGWPEYWGLWSTVLVGQDNRTARTPLGQPGLLPEVERPAFKQSYAPHYDKRLSEGLQQAWVAYMQQFFKTTPTIKRLETQTDVLTYQLEYQVTLANKTQRYLLKLSADAAQVTTNLSALMQVMQRFQQDWAVVGALANTDKEDFVLGTLDVGEWFAQLVQMGTKLDPQSVSTVGHYFNQSGQIFAWLAFFKNSHSRQILADTLATQAVSHYLLGCLLLPDSACKPGILLLGLDYPAAAESALLQTRGEYSQVLVSYLRNNIVELQHYRDQPTANPRLGHYLLARAYLNGGYQNYANQQFQQMMTDLPDFLLGEMLVVSEGGVGARNLYMEDYVAQLLTQHFQWMQRFWDMRPIALQPELTGDFTTALSQKASTDRDFQQQLKLQARLMAENPVMHEASPLLTIDLMRHYLQEEIFSALLSWYEFNATLRGDLSRASQVIALTEAAYPNSAIHHILNLKQWLSYGRSNEVMAYLSKLNTASADLYLLQTLLTIEATWQALQSRPRAIDLLRQYRALQNPNSQGSALLYTYFKAFGYQPFVLDYAKNALAANPYSYRHYQFWLENKLGDSILETGKQRMGQVYGFLQVLAEWNNKRGELELAQAIYRQAIVLAPQQATAYKQLGKIYQMAKQPKQAIKIWQDYLEYDKNSLSAIDLYNDIGYLYLEQGDLDNAEKIFQIAKQSGQRRAVQGLALVFERRGDITKADKLFTANAERYSQGDAATELALFYLRQNNDLSAVRTLKQYRTYQHPAYYYEKLVAHFKQRQQPEAILPLVKAVEEDELNQWLIEALAQQTHQQGLYELAAQLYFSLATTSPKTASGAQANQPYYFAPHYLKSILAGQLMTRATAWKKLFDAYAQMPPPVLEYLGIALLNQGYYPEARQAFQHKYQRVAHRRNVATVMAALSWRLEEQPAVEAKAQLSVWAKQLSGWEQDRVLFLLGDIDEAALFTRANDPQKRCEAYYFLAALKMIQNDYVSAQDYLLLCLETKATNMIEYIYAHTLLLKLAGIVP